MSTHESREALKTYPVSIPSLGLANMAWGLASLRIAGYVLEGPPQPREEAESDPFYDVSAEYYLIIDRLARGEKP